MATQFGGARHGRLDDFHASDSARHRRSSGHQWRGGRVLGRMGALVAVSSGWAAYGIAMDATNESKSPLDRIRALELRVQILEDRPATPKPQNPINLKKTILLNTKSFNNFIYIIITKTWKS